MKKIVALALCLIMALSLATVAFGATNTTSLTAGDYTLVNKTDNSKCDDVAAISKTVQDATSVTGTDGKTTTTYYADKYVITGKNVMTTEDTFYAVDSAADYTYKLVSNGVVVAYLLDTDTAVTADKSATTRTTSTIAEPTCGDLFLAEDDEYVTVSAKNYKVDNAKTTYVYFNGTFIPCDLTATVRVKDHIFAAGCKVKYTDNTAATVASAYCSTCKNYIPVVKTVPAASAVEYYACSDVGGANVAFGGVQYYYTGNAAAAGAATAAGVTSAKTFDAGVALYAGMALMSVAGSAVVIGKKKEF